MLSYGRKDHQIIFKLQASERLQLDKSGNAVRGKLLVGAFR